MGIDMQQRSPGRCWLESYPTHSDVCSTSSGRSSYWLQRRKSDKVGQSG